MWETMFFVPSPEGRGRKQRCTDHSAITLEKSAHTLAYNIFSIAESPAIWIT
jgi:hypothetical protein